ncbi:MAG: S8 family peptidase, partial [Ramlibacter sp.]|nr:S8 family peptidase [Ramlibacter sp.]
PGFNVIPDTLGTYDCHGHGTHVAGTAAGSTWGVAKNAFLIPVRVLDCNGYGTWSNVIAGVDWVANSAMRPAVANLSIGGTPSSALDGAIAGAVAKGVTVVVAAGNSNVDACTASPSREPSAITVGATSSSDARASFSNWGACVDLFAPGVGITSAYNTSNSATYLMSGTSMATPHVSGVAALILESNPTASPAAVTLQIKSGATPNRITTVGTGSPNLLLNSLGTGGGYVAPPPTVVTQSVAVKSMAGSSNRTGGNWKASSAVTVRDVSTGAVVPNATVSGSFLPGGNSSCVTGSTGSCTLTSAAIKSNAASSTTLTATGISGTQMVYDATQNAVTQIVISKP